MFRAVLVPPIFLFAVCLAACETSSPSLGIFEEGSDVGGARAPGLVRWDSEADSYTVTGGGANIWGNRDAFYFVWNQSSGDLLLETEVAWLGEGVDPHRKAGLMVRAGLEEDAPYVDAVVHGDGLIALQYRTEKGGSTNEFRSPVRAPASLRLERHGDVFSASVARPGGDYQPVAALSVSLPDTVFAGLIVCAHNPDVMETAIFSQVIHRNLGVFQMEDREVESTLEVVAAETGERQIVYRSQEHFEAPNWSRDGRSLIFNQQGLLYTIPRIGGQPEQIESGLADRCNNDHGLSPDGKRMALSHSPSGDSLIYVMPAEGGEPRLVTSNGPSYWHGWSPDGRTLAYCAERGGEYDIYTIPASGGDEKRLTTAAGLDDGPDYSPDGQFIYFNSVRTGVMQIWRMRVDGSEQQQVTTDTEYADWFPHPSPDGRQLVFLSYGAEVEGHPPNQDVQLRIMDLPDGEPRVLARLFGGQGTINVPSWSPDSGSIAFVSYRLVGPRQETVKRQGTNRHDQLKLLQDQASADG